MQQVKPDQGDLKEEVGGEDRGGQQTLQAHRGYHAQQQQQVYHGNYGYQNFGPHFAYGNGGGGGQWDQYGAAAAAAHDMYWLEKTAMATAGHYQTGYPGYGDGYGVHHGANDQQHVEPDTVDGVQYYAQQQYGGGAQQQQQQERDSCSYQEARVPPLRPPMDPTRRLQTSAQFLYPWMQIQRVTRPPKTKSPASCGAVTREDEEVSDTEVKAEAAADILKRPRTSFRSDQVLKLEAEFRYNK